MPSDELFDFLVFYSFDDHNMRGSDLLVVCKSSAIELYIETKIW